MKKLLKTVSIIICLIMLLSAIIPAASAATYFVFDDGLKYSKNSDGTLELAGIDKSKEDTITEIVVPEGYYGFKVRTIAQNAFLNNDKITSITLPEGIEVIGNGAFSGCTSLKSMIIPSSVTKIGSNAFYNCNSMETLKICGSITQIPPYSFNRCASLTRVIIPNSVGRICEYAFYLCENLQSVEISSSVKQIDKYAFHTCANLKHVLIKSNVEDMTIAETAFDENYFAEMTIEGVSGSASQDYADAHDIEFIPYDATKYEGDVNDDGYVDGNDVTLMLKYIVGIVNIYDLRTDLGDMDYDGSIDVKDATLIQKRILGVV